jgi:3alpha(or 20beta)-hydroxysteroid dehydrogenase
MFADDLGDQAMFYALDVTSDAGWAATVAASEDAFGPVSVLVNNAGIVHIGLIAETEPAAWQQRRIDPWRRCGYWTSAALTAVR